MFIAVDRNQCTGTHLQSNISNHRALEALGHTLVPTILPYGDYSLMTPAMTDTMKRRGTKIRKLDYAGIIPAVVDRKASMSEIAQNLCSGKDEHARFINEIVVARQCGAQVYILVEDDHIRTISDVEHWQNPRISEYYRRRALEQQGWHFQRPLPAHPPVNGAQLAKTLHTVEERYGARFVFCTPQEAPAAIVGLLTSAPS